MDEKKNLGPLSSEGAAVQLQKQIDETIKMGAKALIGRAEPNRTKLTQCNTEMPYNFNSSTKDSSSISIPYPYIALT